MMKNIILIIKRTVYKIFKILARVFTGFYLPTIHYYFVIFRHEYKYLKLQGFYDIEQHKERPWRLKEIGEGASIRYYTAFRGNKKCFIKIASNDSTITNEIQILQKTVEFETIISPKCLFYDENYKFGKVLVTEFIEGLSWFFIPDDIQTFDRICKDYVCILEELKHFGIIHVDINRANILFDSNLNLVLIDFGQSYSLEYGNNKCVNYAARKGTFYEQNGNIIIYDDAYSFVKMLDKLCISDEFKECKGYKEILTLVGSFQIYIDLDTLEITEKR